MPSRNSMRIDLEPGLRKYLEGQVKSGRYADISEALNASVALARDQEMLTPRDVEELRRKIHVGIDAADRGEFVEFTAKDIMAKGRRVLAARRRGRNRKSNGNIRTRKKA
jgi:putative addiction module CopG family antidote